MRVRVFRVPKEQLRKCPSMGRRCASGVRRLEPALSFVEGVRVFAPPLDYPPAYC